MYGVDSGRSKVLKKFASEALFVWLFFLFSILFLPLEKAFHKDSFIFLQFCLICVFSVFGMLKAYKSRPYSLELVTYFFLLCIYVLWGSHSVCHK